jgi:integrase
LAFTDRTIQALKSKAARYEAWEGAGFGIRVGTTGRKSWILVYHFNGKPRRMTLGDYPAMKLAKARLAASKARDDLDQGIDPGAAKVAEKIAERTAETVADLAGEYLERHARKKKRSADQDERTLNVEIIPRWGSKKAKSITARDVVLLLDEIEKRDAPVMRNRTASLLSKLFRFGVTRGIVDASPAVGIERLPEESRAHVFIVEEIRSLWFGLDNADVDRRTALAIKFALVTGQRRGEVAGIVAAEITNSEYFDGEMIWNLPGDRTKNGRPNVIPLPPLAVKIVHEAIALRTRPLPTRPKRKDRRPHDPTPSKFLFASRIGDKAIEPAALTRALNRNRDKFNIGDGTVHDLRRTFATAHGELGTPPEILKGLLNHTPQEVTERVYNLALTLGPRREAMAKWCEWLEFVLDGMPTGILQKRGKIPNGQIMQDGEFR